MIEQQGFLTEGCFSTIFVERGEKLVTPPLSRGLLRGVLRQSLIDMGEAVEGDVRSEEHTSELQSLMRISYAVFGLKKKTKHKHKHTQNQNHKYVRHLHPTNNEHT